MVSLLDNYFVLHGLVITTLSVIIIGVSWIFMRYAARPVPFSFLKVCQGVASGALVVFAAVILNNYYPLSFFKIVVPALLCAAVVHSIIIVFNLYVQNITQHTLLKFPKFLALCLNYGFFAVISLLMMYYTSPALEIFFYYLTEACIKIGVLIVLYLLIRNEKRQSVQPVIKTMTHETYHFLDGSNNEEINGI